MLFRKSPEVAGARGMANGAGSGAAGGNGTAKPLAKPIIFISYSHKDEPDYPRAGEVKWRSFVQEYLQPAVKFGIVDIWVDQHLHGGDDLDPEIERKLHACDILILLVSTHSMASNYIVDKEIAITRERQAKGEDVRFYPVLLTPTPKIALKTLKGNLIRPPDGKPLSSFPYEERIAVMTSIADEVGELAGQIAEKKRGSAVTPPLIRLGSIELKGEDRLTVGAEVLQPTRSVEVDTVHLPETPYERLVGRDEELKRLDEAWASPSINLFSLVAEGGAGKSTLVNEWLGRMQAENYHGADAILGWSFYSHGSKERATSADQFLNWALEKLGIKLDTTSASAKGEEIVETLAKRRVLLLLDGVEPLQHGPGPQTGQLKDLGLRALLRRFAALPPSEPHRLIVITSRLAIVDIARWKDTAAPVLNVEKLSDEAGAALLRDNGVWGTDNELKAAAHDFAGHPLALGLLASFLKETQFGDVRRRDHIRDLLHDADNPRHDHARRVMESYEKDWLADQPVLLAIMHMVGLFDRPAGEDCLKALREKPAIEGLTDAIVDLSEAELNRAVARLREVRLLSPEDKNAPEELNAHPLVREWFGESLRRKNETAWRAGHSQLYDHLRQTAKEGSWPTLEQLAPLYQAISHGCRAGRHHEALEDVFIDRICRRFGGGEIEFYASYKLGALASDLVAISFFFDKPYETPVGTLPEADRSWVLGGAAYCLCAQGRLPEARLAHRADLQILEGAKYWLPAACAASNLSETELIIGDVASAVTTAERAIAHVHRSGNAFVMMSISLRILADALHTAGQRQKAEAVFANAERQRDPDFDAYPLLYLERDYKYCDLLLGKGNWAAACDRAAQTLEWGKGRQGMYFSSLLPLGGREYPLLDRALGPLTLGRAHIGLALAAGEQSASSRQREVLSLLARGLSNKEIARSLNIAADQERDAQRLVTQCRRRRSSFLLANARLDEAVDGLRAAAHLQYIPLGLLARAVFRRSVGDWQRAERDLDEVEEIAEPGLMKLYLCDLAIERARLAFAQIEAFAPLNGLLEKDNPPEPLPLGAEEVARLKNEATEQLNTAADYIATCGYHKRDEELADLKAVLAGSRRFAGLPPRV